MTKTSSVFEGSLEGLDRSIRELKERMDLITENIECSDQWIQELAVQMVCPNNGQPSTQYEIGAVRSYIAFGRAIISNLFVKR